MNTDDMLACLEESSNSNFQESMATAIEQAKSMSEETRDKIYWHFRSLTNNDINTRCLKRIGLLSLGLPESEVDELCEEKKMNRDEMLKLISELTIKERKRLRREQRGKTKDLQMECGK